MVLSAGYADLTAATRLAARLRPDGTWATLVNAADQFAERVRLHLWAAVAAVDAGGGPAGGHAEDRP